MSVYMERFRELSRRAQAGIAAVVMTLAAVTPALLAGQVGAAPALTLRQLTSTTARPSQATDFAWNFTTPANVATVEFIEIEFCDSPLGACGAGTVNGTDNTTVAADNIPILPASPTATVNGITNDWTGATNSATRVTGRAGATSNQIDIDTSTITNANGDAATIGITGFTNDEEPNVSFYTRVRMFSSDTPNIATNMVYEGVFAQSTSQTLTVNARVQERLDFCVGSTTINSDTVTPGVDCAAVTTAGADPVDIGNIDSGAVNVSPVNATNGGNDKNGIAMVRTNAFNGVSVSYRALSETGSGALKVPGATCVASPVSNTPTDQCFNTSSTQGAWTLGSTGEQFGMTIAGVNGGSTSAYTCATGGVGCNMIRDGEYNGNGTGTYVTDTNQVTSGTTSSGYAWNADSTITTPIATSTGNVGVKVVDDEALILKFAALSGITTPTGQYTVQADFVATTTF